MGRRGPAPPDEEPAPIAPGAGRGHADEPRARDLLGTPGAIDLDPAARFEDGLRARDFSLPMYVRHEMPYHLDPVVWRTGFLAVEERELPAQLYADLRERVPQALLRDLHRPVLEFRVTLEPSEESDAASAFRRAVESIREARRREPIPHVAPLSVDVAEELARRRALMEEPWLPVLGDDAPRRQVSFGPTLGERVFD